MNLVKEYLGKVSLTTEGLWNINKAYSRLCIVYVKERVIVEGLQEITYDTIKSYISRKSVPKGTLITNTVYWQPLGITKDVSAIALEPFIVTFTYDDETETRIPDKDFDEAYSAYQLGKQVILISNGVYTVMGAGDDLLFGFNADTLATLRWNKDEGLYIDQNIVGQGTAGLISVADKSKLDGIDAKATRGLIVSDYMNSTISAVTKLLSAQYGSQKGNINIVTETFGSAGESLAYFTYTLPTASPTTKGGARIGDGLAMDSDLLKWNVNVGIESYEGNIVLKFVDGATNNVLKYVTLYGATSSGDVQRAGLLTASDKAKLNNLSDDIITEYQTVIDGNEDVTGAIIKFSDNDSAEEKFRVTLPIAGNGDAGLMTSVDKAKLDSIAYYGDAVMHFKVTSFDNLTNVLNVTDAENPYVYNPNDYTPVELLTKIATGTGAVKAIVDFTALGITTDFPSTFLRIWEGYLVFNGLDEFQLITDDGHIRFEYSNNLWQLLLYLK